MRQANFRCYNSRVLCTEVCWSDTRRGATGLHTFPSTHPHVYLQSYPSPRTATHPSPQLPLSKLHQVGTGWTRPAAVIRLMPVTSKRSGSKPILAGEGAASDILSFCAADESLCDFSQFSLRFRITCSVVAQLTGSLGMRRKSDTVCAVVFYPPLVFCPPSMPQITN